MFFMPNQLQKVINLAKKTGDRLIVFDTTGSDNIYIVMSLDEYEKLVIGKSEVRNLTEDELLDKINRDIAIWKSEQDYQENKGKEAYFEDNFDYQTKGWSKVDNIIAAEEKKKAKEDSWAIPTDRKEGAEEIIEEDRQYLEEVKF